ncbi:MAG: MBL fold metallo-hydrolase, partial [Thermicanus sp.]|nr:MBL fold metallo-hydrolase [Thermicanus sp.]
MKVTYHGHATVMVETGGKKILFDPFFTGNPKADVKAEDVRPDYILLTHGHGDHTADAVSIAKRTGATIVAVYELATLLGWRGARTHGVGL